MMKKTWRLENDCADFPSLNLSTPYGQVQIYADRSQLKNLRMTHSDAPKILQELSQSDLPHDHLKCLKISAITRSCTGVSTKAIMVHSVGPISTLVEIAEKNGAKGQRRSASGILGTRLPHTHLHRHRPRTTSTISCGGLRPCPRRYNTPLTVGADAFCSTFSIGGLHPVGTQSQKRAVKAVTENLYEGVRYGIPHRTTGKQPQSRPLGSGFGQRTLC